MQNLTFFFFSFTKIADSQATPPSDDIARWSIINEQTQNCWFASDRHKAGTLSVSTASFTTLCCLLLHTEADGVRQLVQMVVLLLYCGYKWFPLVINLILVGKQDHQLCRESIGKWCNDPCTYVEYFKCSTGIQETFDNKIVARIDFFYCII